MRVILIDDEKLSLEQMEHILEAYEDIEIVGAYTDPLKALEEMQMAKPDVVMLDISMPKLDGFQVAWEITNISPDTMIVFVTAFDQYALKAFDVEAIDYVLKPISQKRMDKAVQIMRKRHLTGAYSGDIKNFIVKMDGVREKRIPVWENEAVVLIQIQDIDYCSVVDKRTIISTGKKKYISNNSLMQLEQRLKEQQFFRCHKSFLVNLHKVEKIIPMFHQTFIIKLQQNENEIPVSRHYAKQIREIFGF